MTKHTVARVEDMIATEDDAEVRGMLRAYATLLTKKAETSIRQQQIPPAYATLLAEKENSGTTHWNGTTHYAGCVGAGPKHYECALQEIGRLRGPITHLRGKLEKKAWFSAYEKKPWVGLTDKEIAEIYNQDSLIYKPLEFYRAIEAKLKEKNGG